ncbi:MAG: alpha-ketoacid dehydrogenase subunit beta [Chloroflexi bacterium]|nr:alpha-ketoacid dehydrogenase subunit beta [Chloroflexota bacterium]MCC6897177.1 alpha-ketoacid dehydrogenase subunit beta [Anaerolineae bacterium]
MTEITYREAIRDAQREELERDPSVFLIGEDLRDPWGGAYKTTQNISNVVGNDRVLNTPIAEESIIGAALGAALTGMRPVAELQYLDFVMRAMDSVVNQVAKVRYMSGGQAKVPLVIRAQGGGGKSSAAQHGNSLEAWLCHVPGLFVAMPATPYDAKGLLKTAIRMDDPVFFIEHKMLYMTKGEVPDGDYTLPFGVADIKRKGEDVTIVATSRMVLFALEAAAELEKEGISAEVIDPRTLVPLDEAAILESVHKTNRLVVVNEAVERCGWAAEVTAMVQKCAFSDLDAPIERVCSLNVPLPFQPDMERFVLPSVNDIVRAARLTLGKV